MKTKPAIVNAEADRQFHESARKLGWNPADLWVGDYVDYEWEHVRHIFECEVGDLSGLRVLEFGCNVGATAIVLAALGASVEAVDVNPDCLVLGVLNARRYGFSETIRFGRIAPGARLPFAAEHFDMATCISVLEYVPQGELRALQAEVAQVVRVGGLILVAGTSNRLWPVETHSRRRGINYLPVVADPWLFGRSMQRGVWPWSVRNGFQPCEDLLQRDLRPFLEAQKRMNVRGWKIRLLSLGNIVVRRLGVSVGMLLPSMHLLLRKQRAEGAAVATRAAAAARM